MSVSSNFVETHAIEPNACSMVLSYCRSLTLRQLAALWHPRCLIICRSGNGTPSTIRARGSFAASLRVIRREKEMFTWRIEIRAADRDRLLARILCVLDSHFFQVSSFSAESRAQEMWITCIASSTEDKAYRLQGLLYRLHHVREVSVSFATSGFGGDLAESPRALDTHSGASEASGDTGTSAGRPGNKPFDSI